mmetsp:Transcript_19700/g.32597  ORF Transcript_19700/g.32597 Transcript_19700/m.32597 type:complete len:162 (-) Transcript_19700:313-798(-)|eukprot:CAMPEP_0197733966 /NCGR_PEP_ID=MMETSP1434-20131217/44179_1 /TAXON_ID=265543 /ORGANISM="Minutocellus polymorphus, Strain CCMP3303" /LENGTH=161 /DNA_ID=CAMNT_0043321367 /DNA_START=99 /DNA_END=584 /DNA_ORIENTATION=-
MIRSAVVALILALSVPSGNAFSNAALRTPAAETSTTLYKGRGLMSMEELDTLMASGKTCEESECSVDDVDMLIGELLDQQRELYGRVKQLKTEIKLLDELNEGERNVDEIQETVRAIARIFQLGAKASGNDYPALSRPTGYSGEVGDGPKTAFDVLDPKKA